MFSVGIPSTSTVYTRHTWTHHTRRLDMVRQAHGKVLLDTLGHTMEVMFTIVTMGLGLSAIMVLGTGWTVSRIL